MSHERWRAVVGYKGLYSVSCFGRIKSRQRNGVRMSRIMKGSVIKKGYIIVTLIKNSRRKDVLVHRAVLTAFVGSCPAGMQTCHNDGNPANNNLSNLRWGTCSENSLDKNRHGTMLKGENGNSSKLTWKAVRHIRRNYPEVSVIALSRKFGVDRDTVYRVLNNETWKEDT